jgi:hypothetical protein
MRTKRTHCKRGHEYTEENTCVRASGKRQCRICRLESTRNWVENNRERWNELHREWIAKNPEKAKAINSRVYKKSGNLWHKERDLRKLYGITLEQFDSMLADQANACAVCGEDLVVPCVDHCHSTGKVRKILCPACNKGLGMFRDNPETLAKAAQYVREYAAQ